MAKESMKAKYAAFRKLLSANNEVLELMADMEEKLSGEYLFDMHYIKTNAGLIGYSTLKIIENLDILSKNKRQRLFEIHENISKEIEKILAYKVEIPVCDFTIPLEALSINDAGIAGGKNAGIGEVNNRVNLPTPKGFAVSSYAFIKFMDHNRLVEKISEKLSTIGIEDLESLNKVSKEIYDIIMESGMPPDLEEAIKKAYSLLCEKVGYKTSVSVRSSAIREDSQFSFAGQYGTCLNVPAAAIVHSYKEVVASLFTPRAIFYSKTKGFSEGDMVMAVGILQMVNSISGGVTYSRDPNDPGADRILINAVRGLGKWVVDGTVTPDLYTVSRHPEGTIIDKRISDQEKMLVCARIGGLKEISVPEEQRGKQCLTDEQISLLAEYAIKLEKHYGSPQDIEWAIDAGKKIYVLQSRPLRTYAQRSAQNVCIPTRFEGYNIILDKGVIASKGAGFGKAFVLKDEEDLKDFPEGGILVAQHTSPKFVTVMNKAAAIVTDVGSATGHMASLSREYQVPTILDTEVSTKIIKNGQEITVDAINCNVYEGRVNELLDYTRSKKEPFKDTNLFKTLEKVLKLIVPLNLTDPRDENFAASCCKTFHDITRFSHEAAMEEMFNIGAEHDIEDAMVVDLRAGIPVGIHILDIDGGVKENVKKAHFEDIKSIPFIALLNGMRSMKWPEPPPVDAGGLLGMIAHSASVPEEELKETGQKSFAVLSKNYMNFSIRLGYHFSMIEAYAGDNINDNYVKFFFKGGGAALDRRLRRVRLIREILKELGFKLDVKQDVMDAILTKYKQATIEEKLTVIGKLSAYTKQLDMVMFNDAVTDMYIEQFIKEHIPAPPDLRGT